MSTDEYVTVKLPLDGCQCLEIAPRDNLVSVDDSNLEVANRDYFGLWQPWMLVELSLDDVCLALSSGQVLQPLDSLVK